MNQDKKKKGFYTRGFTTFILTGAFSLIAVTGVVLFITPRGRVAHWTNWTLLGLGKEDWGAIHITTATLFVIAAAVHLFFNWKVILGYLRVKRIAGIRLKRELAASVALGLFVVLGTLSGIPPLSTIVDFHDAIKRSWDQANLRAPVAHAEELRLEEFAELIEMPVDEMVGALEALGFKAASPNARLSHIARDNEAAPVDLYKAIQSERPASSHREQTDGGGLGRGRMTLRELCASGSLSEDGAIDLLRRKGIQATPSSTLRELASSLEVRPGELAAMLTQSETSGRFDCGSSVQTR
jgi:hypothetical protein